MDNEKTVKEWQASIINECVNRLGRKLTSIEKNFITSRGGFMALEAIEDTVKVTNGKELEEYLNSEINEYKTSNKALKRDK